MLHPSQKSGPLTLDPEASLHGRWGGRQSGSSLLQAVEWNLPQEQVHSPSSSMQQSHEGGETEQVPLLHPNLGLCAVRRLAESAPDDANAVQIALEVTDVCLPPNAAAHPWTAPDNT